MCARSVPTRPHADHIAAQMSPELIFENLESRARLDTLCQTESDAPQSGHIVSHCRRVDGWCGETRRTEAYDRPIPNQMPVARYWVKSSHECDRGHLRCEPSPGEAS